MTSKQAYKLFILLFVVSLVVRIAFAGDVSQKSATAVAEKKCDGAIASQQATTTEIKRMEEFRIRLQEVDRKYPGPEMPKNAKLFRVISIDNNGIISLENGRRIRLEGMKCSSKTPDYLRGLLMGDMDRVIYKPSSAKSDDPSAAYIWHADLSLMNDPEMKKFIRSPSYSLLNETALMSGWCTPERSSSNAYNDRYEALSKIANR